MRKTLLSLLFACLLLSGCTHVQYGEVSYTRVLTDVGELHVTKEGDKLTVDVLSVTDKAGEILMKALDKVP